VARQLGHDARLTLTRYGHVIDELDAEPRLAAENAIRAARATNVPLSFLATAEAQGSRGGLTTGLPANAGNTADGARGVLSRDMGLA
jgi:hypothetical protein